MVRTSPPYCLEVEGRGVESCHEREGRLCLVAGLIERQIRRVLAERQEPIHGLMPEGRDHLRPTVPRILSAFAHYSIVHIRNTDGDLIGRQFAKLDAVQQQILDVLGTPSPDQLFGRPVSA